MDYPGSAFLAVSRQDSVTVPQLVPIGSTLIPQSLQSAFGIPCMNLDVRDLPSFPSAIPPPFHAAQENIFTPPWPGNLDTQQNYFRAPVTLNITEASPLERSGKSANQGPEVQPLSHVLPEQVPTASDAKPVHKPRVVWTEELHQRFLRAIEAAGSEEAAVPTVILKLMNVSGLSRDNVASHLQKHRLGLKRGKCSKRRAHSLHTGKQKQLKSEDASGLAQDIGAGEGEMHGASGAWCSERQPQSTAGEAPDLLQPTQQYGRGEGNKRVPSELAEGEGQDCAGSNERDGCDGNDAIGSSDDGAGAGSDNRASACNSGIEKHAAEGCDNPGEEQPASWRPTTDPPDTGAARGALPHPGPAEGEGVRGENTRSPNESGSGSNAASKQARNSGGVSDVHGSAPTAGSGTAQDGRQGSQVQRSGARDLAAMEPVGKPISLPMPPNVPAANATPMEAPKTGASQDPSSL